MRIRIVKEAGQTANGIDLKHYRIGQTYELGATVAEYLVAEGVAIVEMRKDDERARTYPNDRRRS
jgi:hypothetical protein